MTVIRTDGVVTIVKGGREREGDEGRGGYDDSLLGKVRHGQESSVCLHHHFLEHRERERGMRLFMSYSGLFIMCPLC